MLAVERTSSPADRWVACWPRVRSACIATSSVYARSRTAVARGSRTAFPWMRTPTGWRRACEPRCTTVDRTTRTVLCLLCCCSTTTTSRQRVRSRRDPYHSWRAWCVCYNTHDSRTRVCRCLLCCNSWAPRRRDVRWATAAGDAFERRRPCRSNGNSNCTRPCSRCVLGPPRGYAAKNVNISRTQIDSIKEKLTRRGRGLRPEMKT